MSATLIDGIVVRPITDELVRIVIHSDGDKLPFAMQRACAVKLLAELVSAFDTAEKAERRKIAPFPRQ